MTKPNPLVQIERLQKLQEKLGVDFSEPIAKLQNPHIGAPLKWDNFLLYEIFMCVEVIKARGVIPTAAWKAAAKFHHLTYNVVRKAHAKGRKRFAPILETYDSEIVSKLLRDHQAARPRLKRFLRAMKP